MPKYPSSEYTNPHQALHEELLRRFDTISILSEQWYNSSYYIIEGDDKKFFVEELREKNQFEEFMKYTGRHQKDQSLLFKYRKYKFDIYIPEIGIVIEIDGKSHKSLKRELKDIERDELLKEQKITTWRILNEELSSKKKLLAVADEIEENIITQIAIKHYGGKITKYGRKNKYCHS